VVWLSDEVTQKGRAMAELGLQGFPAAPDGVDPFQHCCDILEMVPPEFTSVWISDHFQVHGEPWEDGWTRLTYLAALFPRFRYGHLVLGQSYRNPALLANMAATLQRLTGGRFILGIGAGWLEEEYRAYGWDYPRAGVRVEQLAEAVQVIRAMWDQSPATFHGDHYRIESAHCPRVDVPIPIMVGTNGTKALGVAARHADWWNWDGPWEPTYREPYEKLRAHCEEIGRSIDDIGLTAGATVHMPDDVSTFTSSYTHDFYPGQEFPLLGPTPADVIREMETLVDVGVAHFQLAFEDMPTFHRFLNEVVENVRLERAD
jgi:alkanesulfonate monooxygenase SsuD/methylene tetrahydromethanopterin reductase-like flavin-dependent oxidoreductase (luciferase family)